MNGSQSVLNGGSQMSPTQTESDRKLPAQSSSSDGSSERLTRRQPSEPVGDRERLAAALQPPRQEPVTPVEPEAGVDPEPGGAPGADTVAPEEGQTPEPLTLQSVAERLELTETDLYDTLTIDTGDGERRSLSDIKAAMKAQKEAEQGIAERASSLDGREADLIRDMDRLRVLKQAGLPKQAQAQVDDILAGELKRETEWLMQLAPELQDQANLAAFRNQAAEAMGSLGIPPTRFATVMSNAYTGIVVRELIRLRSENGALKEASRPKPPKASKVTPGAAAVSKAGQRNAAARNATGARGKIAAALGKG